ncbi:helix-turn-helix domain-containing protein [Alkalihalobacterium alkalinitrilicum]|uniref:helix-turn-helix domain-containing protein n=1 Tax=Alkalihalobacterium alkalinitrilicum TaxID=427920 RepID=UPI001EE3C04F|nr:helix-turn-helix domain-containing protein [Alkalihalobacterium alkalinitrilicum]
MIEIKVINDDDGNIVFQNHPQTENTQTDIIETSNDYPYILTATHISEIMGISKRVAYEIMDYKDFPLIRIGRTKRVKRESFFRWLEQQENSQNPPEKDKTY